MTEIGTHAEQHDHAADREAWVDTTDAGAQIGVCGATVRNMIRDGRLRGYRIGRQFRVAQADVTAFKHAALLA